MSVQMEKLLSEYTQVGKHRWHGTAGISPSLLYHLIFHKVPTYTPLITQDTLNLNDTLNQINLRIDLAFSLSLKLFKGDID